MAEIIGGELLVRCLHAEGVQFIHAVTDGTYMMVIEALDRLGKDLGIRLIVPRHEAAAAHACDAYTRVTGDSAVVMACAGPEAANLLAGLMCAEAEGSPVVATAMGCHGEYVTKGLEIESALQRSQSSGKPAVIHAVVDPVATWILPATGCGRRREQGSWKCSLIGFRFRVLGSKVINF